MTLLQALSRDPIRTFCENLTVPRAVDGVLTTVLSHEATTRRTQLTMDTLVKENRRLELDLSGLKS